MKKITKILVLMLVLALAFSLVSCGGKDSKKDDPKVESSADTNSSDVNSSSTDSSEVSTDSSADSSADVSADVSTDASTDASEDTSSADDLSSDAQAYYGTPKVDVIDIDPLWDNVPEYKGEKIRWTAGTFSEGKVIEDTGTRFTFKLMWDETHLYVLEHVTDISIGAFNEDLTWQNDSTEISMSLNANRGTSYNDLYDGWVGFSPYEYTYGGARIHGDGLENVEFAVDFDETGYYVCAAFDISAMNLDIEWKEGHQIGFEISVNDSVIDTERACCLGWCDDTDDASTNPSTFGIVTLVK